MGENVMFNSCAYIDADCDDGGGFNSILFPIANKEHCCCECKAIIHPKDKYEKATHMWEGDIYRYKTCMTCVNVRNSLFDKGFYYGMLIDSLHKHYEIDFYTELPEWGDEEEEKDIEEGHIYWAKKELRERNERKLDREAV